MKQTNYPESRNMSIIMMDSLSISKRLKAHKVPTEQAEAIASEIVASHQVSLEKLATKDELRTEIMLLRKDMEAMRHSIVNRLGAMILALGGVLIAVKYFG